MYLWCGFFFQAEDGILDLVRSRGLGDVYKRQGRSRICVPRKAIGVRDSTDHSVDATGVEEPLAIPVSYTHLTLPTSDLV